MVNNSDNYNQLTINNNSLKNLELVNDSVLFTKKIINITLNLNELLSEINQLENKKIKLEDENKQRRLKLMQQWKNKEISTDDFTVESRNLENINSELINNINILKNKFRIDTIELLNIKTKKDAKIKFVESLNLEHNIYNYLGEDLQDGGSNAMGVIEIKGTNLLAIIKTQGSYEYIGDLTYYTSLLNNNPCIPRTLKVFVKDGKTYQIIEKASGIQLDKLSITYIENIPQVHYDNLVKNIIKLGKNGIMIDPSKASNFFYDEKLGFLIIDLSKGNLNLEKLGANLNSFLTYGISGYPNELIENKVNLAIKKIEK